jgi:7 transmembrane receptor (rhodopsin family)
MNWSNASLYETNKTSSGLSPFKQRELLAWIIITAVITFIGGFNNVLAVLVTWPRPNVQSNFNLLLFHFAIINLFMCLVNVPIHVFMILAKQSGYVVSSSVCKYLHVFHATGIGLVNWADAGLALSRCIALILPHHYKTWNTKMANLGILALAWAFSLGAYLPVSFGVGGRFQLMSLGQCSYMPAAGDMGKFVLTITSYVPYTLVGLASILIFWKTRTMSQNRVGNDSATDGYRRVVLRRIRMAKVLLVSFLWSAICNLPGTVITMNFPILFVRDPVSILWTRTCVACQYSFSPVSLTDIL